MLTDVVDPAERNRIIELNNFYNTMTIQQQNMFAAYSSLPMLRYDDATNTARTLNSVLRNTVLGMFWGCLLNGREFV